jgi:ribulose-5-phosphate 4-epimerase/fuculose-1-phosphate aldolase
MPGEQAMLLCAAEAGDSVVTRVEFAQAQGDASLHASVYLARADVGAVALGGGAFGRVLGELGGRLPQVFDEQARHLGRTASPLPTIGLDLETDARRCLATGGNVWVCERRVLILGTTSQRLVLNAELAEKCAKAYSLAMATGDHVHTLPWWVCHIANGRLTKDRKRAAARFAQGLLPEETVGY